MSTPYLVLAQVGSSGWSTVIFIGVLFVIMYFVMIRPQQKQARQQQSMLSALKKGDDVITQGGFLGKVYAVAEKVVTLELSSNVRVRVLKTSIQGKVSGMEEESKSEEKKEEK